MSLALISLVGSVLDKIVPDPATAADAKFKLLELAQKGDMATLDADVRLALAQIDVNKTEAAMPGVFKGGGRPAALWVCVFALAYNFLLRPLLPWLLTVCGVHDVPPLPVIDGDELLGLMFGLLGLSGYRSLERIKGKA